MEITGLGWLGTRTPRATIELVGDPGPTWRHFRGPDDNIYELVADS